MDGIVPNADYTHGTNLLRGSMLPASLSKALP
jgi:hypothetical protein